MKFTKMHGAGNDYIYVDCTQSVIDNPSQVAIDLSDRHFGIGSDGLILIKNSDKADFFMEMYNADGSQGQMCGNGIRCVGKFVYDNGLTDKTTVTIDTLAGVKILELKTGADGKVETARVNMGAPILEAAQIPVDTKELKEYKGCEIETIDIKKFEIEKIGPFFENHKAFPERINTEFIQVVDKNNLNMRVWERGSGETLACGTGACASLVATVLNGMCDTTATLHLLGGDLKITWDKDENTVYLEGPAKTVFTGEVDI